MLTAKERLAQYLRGDVADWPAMYMRGEIDEQTLYDKVGLQPHEIAVVAVPSPQARTFRGRGT